MLWDDILPRDCRWGANGRLRTKLKGTDAFGICLCEQARQRKPEEIRLEVRVSTGNLAIDYSRVSRCMDFVLAIGSMGVIMFGNSFQIKYVCTEVTTQKSRVAGGSTAKTLVSHEVVGRGLGLLLRDLDNEIRGSTPAMSPSSCHVCSPNRCSAPPSGVAVPPPRRLKRPRLT